MTELTVRKSKSALSATRSKTLFVNKYTGESYLQQIHDEEEDDMVPYAIREEILDRVMNHIYDKYLEKEMYNFVIECAFDAFIQFLNMEFYFHHIPSIYETDLAWTSDLPPEPSPPDTWAHRREDIQLPPEELEVPVKSETAITLHSEQELSEGSRFDIWPPYPSFRDPTCETSTDVSLDKVEITEVSTDVDYQEDLFKYLAQQTQVVVEEESTPSIASEVQSDHPTINDILDEILEQVDREAAGSEYNFLNFAKTLKKLGTCEVSQQKVPKKLSTKLPPIQLSTEKEDQDKIEKKSIALEGLPPIRFETQFEISSEIVEDDKSKKGKKSRKSKT